MEIKRVSLNMGSCNNCYMGKLNEKKDGFNFPYDETTEIGVGGMQIRLCDKCLNELKVILNLEIVNQDKEESDGSN